MSCKSCMGCRYHCDITESCDYMLLTGRRRPVKAAECPGYPGRFLGGRERILLPGSRIFGAAGEGRGANEFRA